MAQSVPLALTLTFGKHTKKSDGPRYLIRLFDKSRRSNDVSDVNEWAGTFISALFGNPSACNGIFNPRNACRWTRLISPDDITSPCNETLSKIRASLKNVTFFSVQSSSDTGYLDWRRPCAICCKPWISPLHRNVYGMSHVHSKYRLFSLIFGHFQSSMVVSWSIPVDLIFRLRKSFLLYAFPLPFDFFVAGCTFGDDDSAAAADDVDRLCVCICVCSIELLLTIELIALRGLSMLWFLVDDGPLLRNASLFAIVAFVVDLLICCGLLYSLDESIPPSNVDDNDNGNGNDDDDDNGISCGSFSITFIVVVWLSINGSFMLVEFIWWMTSKTLSRCKL